MLTAAPRSSSLPADLLAAQSAFWSSALSGDTLSGYHSRRNKWLDFSTRFGRAPDDLSPRNIIDYATYLGTIANRGEPHAFSTIKSYVDFLGRATSFTSPDAPNPVQHPEVALFLKGVARVLGKKVDKAEPCTLDHLRAVNLAAQSNPSSAEWQTTATLAFWGCLRLGALVPKRPGKGKPVLTLADLTLSSTALIVSLNHSKTNQFQERTHRIELPARADPLSCPVRALNRWFSTLQPRSSQTTLSALSSTSNIRLSRSRFLDLVNLAARPAVPLSGHSFRRGFVRLAFASGVPIWQLMHHGEWKTLEVVMAYAEDALIPNPLRGL